MPDVIERINKASLRFLAPLTFEETLARIVQEANRLIGAEYGSIVLEKDNKLERIYASSPVAFKTKNRKRGNTYRAFVTKQVIIADISELEQAHPELKKTGIQTTMFIPLSYRGKSIGVLTLNIKKGLKKWKRNVEMLKLFGSMASFAIRKAQLYQEITKALEIRDLFISMAAHELRTPLTTISVYSQLLGKKLKSADNPTLSRWAEILSLETKRLSDLVDELLTVKHIKSGELQYVWKEVSIREILGRAFLAFTTSHPNYQLDFSEMPDHNRDKAIGDADKLLQVFINILNNAAKFSIEGSKIQVNLKLSPPYIAVEVKDSGQGITKEDLPRIFEGFYKGKNNTKEGMGIGLFLSKNIIEKHRGTILIRSKKDRGTSVIIKLPGVNL